MNKRLALYALAGCKADYTFDEISAKAGRLGSPHALYIEPQSGKPLNGTVTHKVDAPPPGSANGDSSGGDGDLAAPG